MLGAFTNELDRIAPKFEVHGSQIQILRTPGEFYETLKVGTHVTMRGYLLMEVDQDIRRRKAHFSVDVVHRKNRT